MADREKVYDAVIASPFGRLGIQARTALTSIDFVSPRRPLKQPCTPVARRACAQLRAYFRNPRARFDLPLAPGGSKFQNDVWRAMRRIPSGQVRSYGDLAKSLDSAARAVGGACRANPIPIVVPCHRVVSASGLGGFMGATGGRALEIKRGLLEHERARR
jgi:methylated-DNA-[protein]-cysteine S-methyltransferase